jgi:hypothetical protein
MKVGTCKIMAKEFVGACWQGIILILKSIIDFGWVKTLVQRKEIKYGLLFTEAFKCRYTYPPNPRIGDSSDRADRPNVTCQ